jgi:hypothetical protein
MRTALRPITRVVLVVLACVAMAMAGGAPSDHHIRNGGGTTTVGGQ